MPRDPSGPPSSNRLDLRAWRTTDAEQAWPIFGADDVARWLLPAMTRVEDEAAMRAVLEAWIAEADRMPVPLGRWAMVRRDDDRVVGSIALLPIPPEGEDSEVAWAVAPEFQRQGYATEAARTLTRWALENGAPEVLAVSRPRNQAGLAVARKLGMDWVGETDKYYGLRLDVHRLHLGDLTGDPAS